MKRQHPTDPNLFWCPKCKTYKGKGEFGYSTRRSLNVDWLCKECRNSKSAMYYNKLDSNFVNLRQRNYRKNNPEIEKKAHVNYRKSHYKKYCENKKRNAGKSVDNLKDRYIRGILNKLGSAITPETIELKRQQIIMKRTLKQLKEWRKEHESDRDVISGEQREDETVNEINRGREETGYGGDSGLPAGM